MGMIRVHELAKVFDLTSKEVLDQLNKAGFKVKSHSSNVNEERARLLLTRYVWCVSWVMPPI